MIAFQYFKCIGWMHQISAFLGITLQNFGIFQPKLNLTKNYQSSFVFAIKSAFFKVVNKKRLEKLKNML